MTKLMDRIFSAQEAGESIVLDQISKDIEDAKETGQLSTDEYDIVKNDQGLVITDKVNNEDTLVTESGNEYQLSEPDANKVKVFTRLNHRLAVVDEDNELKGIFNRGDAAKFVKDNPRFRLMKVQDYRSIK